jgi:hypothetical protein
MNNDKYKICAFCIKDKNPGWNKHNISECTVLAELTCQYCHNKGHTMSKCQGCKRKFKNTQSPDSNSQSLIDLVNDENKSEVNSQIKTKISRPPIINLNLENDEQKNLRINNDSFIKLYSKHSPNYKKFTQYNKQSVKKEQIQKQEFTIQTQHNDEPNKKKNNKNPKKSNIHIKKIQSKDNIQPTDKVKTLEKVETLEKVKTLENKDKIYSENMKKKWYIVFILNINKTKDSLIKLDDKIIKKIINHWSLWVEGTNDDCEYAKLSRNIQLAEDYCRLLFEIFGNEWLLKSENDFRFDCMFLRDIREIKRKQFINHKLNGDFSLINNNKYEKLYDDFLNKKNYYKSIHEQERLYLNPIYKILNELNLLDELNLSDDIKLYLDDFNSITNPNVKYYSLF